ncbi:MAG: OmpA family protein [Bacteroidales bacterium]|jgi:outer membrane protein OmpA-like peptidoglycan-associated protein/tetratricopeptide (TPR) repeat protein|nr:OmpA family protein [Bacteroidales bacterium]
MRIFKITILSLFILCANSLFSKAQENLKIKKSDFKIEIKEVGFKDAWKDIKEGEKLFTAGLGTFPNALVYYLKANKYNSECAKLSYKIGVCYLATDKFYYATEYLEKAYLKDNNIADDVHLMLARAYHLNLDFDNAIENYNAYYNSFSVKNLEKYDISVDKYIKECKYGQELVNSPVRVIINNLGERINSEFDDYNPVLHPNQNLLYFTSRCNVDKKDKRLKVDNKYKENIFISEQAGELWRKPKIIENKLDSKSNESLLTLSSDGSKIFLYNGEENGGDIMVSELKKDSWKSPKRISGRILSKSKETTITFSPDESEMFFVSNQYGTIGGMDIFYSKIDAKGKWTEPMNMNAAINTPYDEEAVYWHPKVDKLYFSSQGHNSMGGFDVFVMERDINGVWSSPENLGYPINTPSDDIFFKMDETNKHAYYSSVRDNGYGGKDLYKVIILGEEKMLKLKTDDIYLAWNHIPIDDLFYHVPSEIKVDTALFMVGMVTDSKSGESIKLTKIEVIDLELSQVVATGLTDTAGMYQIKIPKNKDYGVEVTAKDYLFFVEIAYLSQKQVVKSKITVNFQLDKIDVGATMVLNNIFFETNKATIKVESTTELERLANLLIENPTIRLEISGHTDNVGSFRANQKLSESRAKSVVDYMVSKGVGSSRLEYKGYSFNQPIADNNTAEGRGKNRRVEFKVLSK